MSEGSLAFSGAPQSPAFAATLRRAAHHARQRSHRYVTLEHMLLALTEDPDAQAMLHAVGCDAGQLRTRIGEIVATRLSTLYAPGEYELRPSYKLERVLHVAGEDAAKAAPGLLDGAYALTALASESDSMAAGLLRQHGLDFQRAVAWLAARRSAAPEPWRDSLDEIWRGGTGARQDAGRRRSEGAPPPPQDQQAHKPAPDHHQGRQTRPATPPAPSSFPAPEPAADGRLDGMRREPRFGGAPGGAPQLEPRREAPPAQPRPAAPAPEAYAPPSRPPRRERERGLTKKLENVVPEEEASLPSLSTKPADAAAAPIEAGKLVENIPRRMRSGVTDLVEVRISREETEDLMLGLQGSGAPETHDIVIARAMTVMLRSPDGAFVVETLAPETQWVFDRPSFIETERYGRWRWAVTPRRAGKHRLQVIVSARSLDDHGLAGDTALPDQVIEVKVRANYARGFRKLFESAFLLVSGGVLTEVVLRMLPRLSELQAQFWP